MSKKELQVVSIDDVILTLLKKEYQAGNEEFIDLKEELGSYDQDDILQSAKYLNAQGLLSLQTQNDEIFARITIKGLGLIQAPRKQKSFRKSIDETAKFLSNTQIIVGTLALAVAGVAGLATQYGGLEALNLQGSLLQVQEGSGTRAEIEKQIGMKNLVITSLGEADGKHLFQVEGSDSGMAVYFYVEMTQRADGTWQVLSVEQLH